MPSKSSKTYYKEKKEAETSGSSSNKENSKKKLADRVAGPDEPTGTISGGKYKFDIGRASDFKATEEQRRSARIAAKEAAKDAEGKK